MGPEATTDSLTVFWHSMTAEGFAVFETAIGQCGIAWGARGVVAMQLPEASDADALARLQKRFPGAREATPPSAVHDAIQLIAALLRGESADLSGIVVDVDDVPEFNRRVYAIARTIPPGTTLTYGEIAARLGGEPGAARAVGQALGRNPVPIIVPCHRVLAMDGRMHGFSAPGGVTTKLRILAIEGWKAVDGPSLFDGEVVVAAHPSTSSALI